MRHRTQENVNGAEPVQLLLRGVSMLLSSPFRGVALVQSELPLPSCECGGIGIHIRLKI
jgi:hypothetical protein